jgi:hypothetical protein
MSVTAEDCVRTLKKLGLSSTAADVARCMGVTSRHVATALRQPAKDGRVTRRFIKGRAWYRFVRLAVVKGET